AAGAVPYRDGEGYRPGRPATTGAGEASAGPGERLHRGRCGDRAVSDPAVERAGGQPLHPVRHGREGDGVRRQGGRCGEGLLLNSGGHAAVRREREVTLLPYVVDFAFIERLK